MLQVGIHRDPEQLMGTLRKLRRQMDIIVSEVSVVLFLGPSLAFRPLVVESERWTEVIKLVTLCLIKYTLVWVGKHIFSHFYITHQKKRRIFCNFL